MAPAPPIDRGEPSASADAYVRLRRPLLRAAGRWFPSLTADDLEDVYQAAWLSALRTKAPIDNFEAYLYEAAHSQGLMELRRRRRRPAESLDQLDPAHEGCGGATAGEPVGMAADPGPEEQVEARAIGGLVREVLAELTPRQRQVAKLRWGWGLSREEIAASLGLSPRSVKRELRGASERLASEGEVIRAGRWCERRRSLITAYALGVLSPAQQRRARLHLDGCPGCRALVIEQRRRAGLLTALMPSPIAGPPSEGGWSSLAAAVEQLRERAVEVAAGAKQQVAIGAARASDPTPLAGARPGAAALVVAGCIAAGGGTYCAVDGLSEVWRSPPPSDPPATTQPPDRPVDPDQGSGQPVAEQAPSIPAEPQPLPTPVAETPTAPDPVPAQPSPPSQPQDPAAGEFSPASGPTGPQASAAPAAASVPDGGEFGP